MTNRQIKTELLSRVADLTAEVTLVLDALEAMDNLGNEAGDIHDQLSSMIEGNAKVQRSTMNAQEINNI